jgi:hypothetical protein
MQREKTAANAELLLTEISPGVRLSSGSAVAPEPYKGYASAVWSESLAIRRA